jgi:hypothetical protein
VVGVFERGGCGDDEKAAVAHDLDGGFGGAVEEVDAEDAVVDRSCVVYATSQTKLGDPDHFRASFLQIGISRT